MKENKHLEFAILQFLIETDEYNHGLPETDFLIRFKKSPQYCLQTEGTVFVNSLILSHCRLLQLREYISYGHSASAGGNIIGPVLPKGYDFLETKRGEE